MSLYDAFTFFNELDLLEIRLNILNNVVDRFVIVEATRSFQNKKKPLFFEMNKERFVRFLPKIIHVIVNDMPDSKNTRLLEAHQRNAIARGLSNCKPGDMILLSDLDEIPSPEKIKNVKKGNGKIYAFRQQLYYYYLNFACKEFPDLPWSIMSDFQSFSSPQKMRQHLISAQAKLLGGAQQIDGITLIQNGGWHFSYIGGIDSIMDKLRSFADPVYNQSIYQNTDFIKNAIAQGKDLFGRNLNFMKVPIDNAFPKFIRNNIERFENLIHE